MLRNSATRFFQIALKPTQTKASVTTALAANSSVSHHLNPTLSCNTQHLQQLRQLSTQRKQKRFPNPKIRTHVVSFIDGDYNDYEDGVEVEQAFSSDDWDVVPKEEELNEDALLQKQMEEKALRMKQEEDAKRKRWIENAKPPVRVPEIDDRGRSYGRGGRKTSTARVWIQPGEGNITVNRREFLDYFPRESDRELILSPFIATNTCGKFDVTVAVEGGGVTGKAGAIRHGIARALEKYNPDYRPPMKRLGFMTRDARMVERKKIGLKKARRAPQWVRR
jgi:Ribosomal protein S9